MLSKFLARRKAKIIIKMVSKGASYYDLYQYMKIPDDVLASDAMGILAVRINDLTNRMKGLK